MKRFKNSPPFVQAIVLIIFTVLFSAVFNHLELVWKLILFIIDLLKPLLVGLILAFFLNVPMRGMEKLLASVQRKRKKPIRERVNSMVSLVLTYVLVPLAFFWMFYTVIPQVINAIPSVAASVEAAWPKLLAFLAQFNIDTSTITALIDTIDLNKIVLTITSNWDTIVQTSVSAVSSVVTILTVAITGFVISIYTLANKKKLLRQSKRLLYAYTGKRFADRVSQIASLTNETFTDFLAGQCIESLILGMMFFITMTILRLPFALVISVFIAFTALIPYVGAFLGLALGALLILTASPAKALIFIIVSLVIQQVENQLIYPKVVGTSVGLPAMWILIAVFAGGKVFGVVGMIFCIPLVSVVYSLLRVNIDQRLKRKKLTVDDSGVAEEAESDDQEACP